MDYMTGEPIERGCGVREPGGIYFETRTGKRGRPVEDFLFDPPLPLGNLELPARGVLILARPDGSGIYDVYDRVGEANYPNVADMVEEIRRFGLSRRAGKGLDFSLLGPGSLIFLTHPRAIVTNVDDLYLALREERDENPDACHRFTCPCGKEAHASLPDLGTWDTAPMCVGTWWDLVTKGEPEWDLDAPRRTVYRTNGSTRYTGRQAPHGFKPQYQEGIFARFPIHNLAVINDPEGQEADKAMRRLESCKLPIIETDF